MTQCVECKKSYRTDIILNEKGIKIREGATAREIDELITNNAIMCPDCGGKLSPSEPFNLMFEVEIGPYGRTTRGFGRPEAAQGQFVNFKRVYAAMRERLPLGIAQIGRCMRNEIAPRKGPIRLREFTIIDYEVFLDPDESKYPRVVLVGDQILRILTVNQQERGLDEVSIVTVNQALVEGLIKSEAVAYFMALASRFIEDLGIPKDKQRFREQLPDERAHYSLQTFDQEVWLERWGWTEVSGHAYRTDFDLSRHMAYSGEDLRVYKSFEAPKSVKVPVINPKREKIREDFGSQADNVLKMLSNSDAFTVKGSLERSGFYEIPGKSSIRLDDKHLEVTYRMEEMQGRWFIPHVAEPSFGIDRIFYSVLEYSYEKRKKRTVLKLPRDIAPIKAAIYPLVTKDSLPELAKKIYSMLIDEGFWVEYDDSGSIGRRYARADEVGVPICVTIDYQSLDDNTVTLRDLETWKQVRVNVDNLPMLLENYLNKKAIFEDLGISLN
jgi:glycyl-tRNA synthetase